MKLAMFTVFLPLDKSWEVNKISHYDCDYIIALKWVPLSKDTSLLRHNILSPL